MKIFDKWLYAKVRDMWDNRHKYEADRDYNETKAIKMSLVGAQSIERGSPEGEDRISFELSAAVGGRILNVRRYDNKTDRNNTTTYVIASGEDVGARVAKILNLELLK
jgi:hypothetical protein